jgi:hypothetical protein
MRPGRERRSRRPAVAIDRPALNLKCTVVSTAKQKRPQTIRLENLLAQTRKT